MTDRVSNLASNTGIAVAMVGSAVQNVFLTFLGPAIALAVHVWTEWRMRKIQTDDASLVEHLKVRNFQLEMEVAKLRGAVPTPPQLLP